MSQNVRRSCGHYMPLDDLDELLEDDSNQQVPADGTQTDHDGLSSSSSRIEQLRSYQQRLSCPRIPARFRVELTDRQKVVRDIVICVLSLVLVPVICLGLGWYTVFILKPSPVIDKSYNAFKIPNHVASLNNEAFNMAKRNHTSFSAIDISGGFQGDSTSGYKGITGGKPGGSFDTGGAGRRKRSTNSGKSFLKLLKNIVHGKHSRIKRRSYNPGSSIVNVPLQYRAAWKMQVVFMVGKGENIFTPERLEKIHAIEKVIMQREQFPEFCFKDMYLVDKDPTIKVHDDCAPLNSLMTYFFPSTDDKGKIYYDGLGDNIVNIDSALKLAMQSQHFYFYVDDKVNSSNLKSQLLRTEVLFGAPLKGFRNPYQEKQEQTKLYKEFVVKYIDILSQASTSDITVLYGGNEIFDYEVEMTFWNDIRLATYSLIAIFILMLVLTYGSVWLTICGLVSISCSIPLAIFFYRIVFRIVGLGILNGAAVFVIIGIGVDDVFVFINVFRQANHLSDTRSRVMYTIKTAGAATFFTSSTTAAAFAANIASMIPAVHDFGLFMTLIVSSCWITVMLIMPPALYIWSYTCSRCETCLTSRCVCGSSSQKCSLPDEVANFMDGNHSNTGVTTVGRQVTAEEVDVPMLSMDLTVQYGDSDEERDAPLLSLDPDPLYSPEEEEEERARKRGQFGSFFQGLIYHYIALPIIRVRWGIIVVSTLILVTCGVLMSQLHPSTRPPQFFRSTSNMQQLLDLKAKYSTFDAVQCDECSAIYSVDDTASPPRPPTTQTPPTVTTPRRNHSSQPETPRPTTPQPDTARPQTTQPDVPTPRPHTRTARPPHTTRRPHIATPEPATPAHQIFTPPSVTKRQKQPDSVPDNFNVCKDRACGTPKERPLLESGATVYVVFGVKDFKLKEQDIGHVLAKTQGELTYDSSFSKNFNFTDLRTVRENMKQLCMICKLIANRTELVRNGSAQCLPTSSMPYFLRKELMYTIPECHNLPTTSYIYGRQQPAHAIGSLTADRKAILWLGFAFESTTSKGKSYFEAFKDYQLWEDYLKELKEKHLPGESPLQGMFQTSDFWPEVLMEVIAVDSAIYGVGLSLVICLVSVAIFTRHILLLLVVVISIIEMVCCVVGIFYLVGWEIGGVEAVSLSILVGSSVDYCVHLVEGYILAAAACPIKDNAAKARQWRTSAAFSHIGLSIISSALTTIIAVIPLTQTAIQPFAKFGQIIAINTTVCIIYSLTVCTALLSTIGPAYFKPTWKSLVKVFIATSVVVGTVVLILFGVSKAGVDIQGPNGAPLFPK